MTANTVRRQSCLRFSIPMRGNEISGTGGDYRVMQFSIPMRGNETLQYGEPAFSATVFDPHEGQ